MLQRRKFKNFKSSKKTVYSQHFRHPTCGSSTPSKSPVLLGHQLGAVHFNSDRSPGARRPHGVKTRCPRTAPTSTPSAGTGSPGRPHLCPTRLHTEGPRDALLRERRQHVADSPIYQKGMNSQRERWRTRPGGAPERGSFCLRAVWGGVTLPTCGRVPQPGSSRNPST